MSQSFIQTELSEIGKSFREAVSRLQAIENDFKELQALYKLSNSRDQDSVRVYHQDSSKNSDSESDQSCDANLSGRSASEFSEFANFQQQYENENLSQQELEDLWEQFNSHRIHESDDNFSSSEQQEEQEIEFEIYSNADENESLDPGGSQSPFSEASFNSADN
jgi:hypothetical protein